MTCATLLALGATAAAAGGPRGAGTAARRDRLRIALVLCGGTVLGAVDGATLDRACTANLLSGAPVVAEGVVASRSGPAGRDRLRVRLVHVDLRSGARRCRVPGLLARVWMPPDGATPEPGRLVRVSGEWTRFPASGEWPAAPDRHGLLAGRLERAAGGDAAPAAAGVLRTLRHRAAARLAARLPADVAPSGLALLLAERDEIDPALRRRFAEAGLAHLLAISGMHVGLLAAGAVWLCGLRLGPRSRVAVALAAVTAYVLVIGAPPAARRALVVLAGWGWGRIRGWPVRAGELLGAALLAALLAAPSSLLDPGLQLSFAGFAGVVTGRRAADRIVVPDRWRRAAAAAGASAGAVLATAPITAMHFGQLAPVSLVSHVAGGPLVAAALTGLVGTLALPAPVAGGAADLATGALRALHAAAELFASLPGGHRAVPAPPIAVWVAWILLLDGIRRLVRSGRPIAFLPPAVAAAAVLAAAPLVRVPDRGRALLCTLSVGQGDAAVFRTGSGRWIVFDGGPAFRDWNAGRSIVAPFLRREGASRVDLAVLSHPDLDHLGGLAGLLPEIRVERVIDSGDPVPSTAYLDFLSAIEADGVRWLPAAAGDRMRLGGARLTILGPGSRAGAGTNATSLSVRLTVAGGFVYLNTGDATMAEEAGLLAAWPGDSLRADLFKVGHHGSRTSSAADFLAAVRPSLAVVSAGAGNRYGHPHPAVLARLDSAGVSRVWRTDLHGTLCVEIDRAGRWRIRGETTWREPARLTDTTARSYRPRPRPADPPNGG